MAHLFEDLSPDTSYWDKKSGLTKAQWRAALLTSRTLYVGNLSFYTSEDQVYEVFSYCGEVVKVTMGLNRYKRSPCGFCFVEYRSHEEAAVAQRLLNLYTFDDRTIRVDWDAGVDADEARKFGRGETGGQWRDDFRDDFDEHRGGQGKGLLKEIDDGSGLQIFIGKRQQSGGWEEGTGGGKGKGRFFDGKGFKGGKGGGGKGGRGKGKSGHRVVLTEAAHKGKGPRNEYHGVMFRRDLAKIMRRAVVRPTEMPTFTRINGCEMNKVPAYRSRSTCVGATDVRRQTFSRLSGLFGCI